MNRNTYIIGLSVLAFCFSQEVSFQFTHVDYDSARIAISCDTEVSGFQIVIAADAQLNLQYFDVVQHETMDGFMLSISPESGMIVAFTLTGWALPPGVTPPAPGGGWMA